MNVRKAKDEEWKAVRSFYWKVIEEMASAVYQPGWEKGVYPTDAFIQESIKEENLYVLEKDAEIAAAMVLNHQGTSGYEKAAWSIQADADEVTVIHALGVLPSMQGKGLAKYMVQEALRIAEGNRQKAVRLDVLGTNIPAQKLYTKLGFQYCDRIPLFYEDTGLTDFLLYEYSLCQQETE